MRNDDPRILALPPHRLRSLMVRWALYGQRGAHEPFGVSTYMADSREHAAAGRAVLATRNDPAYARARQRGWVRYLKYGMTDVPLEPDHPAVMTLPGHRYRDLMVWMATVNPAGGYSVWFSGPYYMESEAHRLADRALRKAIYERQIYPDGRRDFIPEVVDVPRSRLDAWRVTAERVKSARLTEEGRKTHRHVLTICKILSVELGSFVHVPTTRNLGTVCGAAMFLKHFIEPSDHTPRLEKLINEADQLLRSAGRGKLEG